MGDLRNKIAKLERAAAEKAAFGAWERRHGGAYRMPKTRPQPLIACQVCARDYYQVTVYCIDQGRWRPALYLCEDHLRPEDRAEMGR